MRVYTFYGDGTVFQKFRSICAGIAAAKGDETRVYVHVDGIPNPWWVHPVVNGKVNRKKIYKEIPRKRFKKKVSLL